MFINITFCVTECNSYVTPPQIFFLYSRMLFEFRKKNWLCVDIDVHIFFGGQHGVWPHGIFEYDNFDSAERTSKSCY